MDFWRDVRCQTSRFRFMGECEVNPTTCSVLGGSFDNSSSGSHNGLFSAGRSSNHGDGVNGRGKKSVNKRRRRGDVCVSRYRRRSKRKRFFERGSLARDIERGAIYPRRPLFRIVSIESNPGDFYMTWKFIFIPL